MQEQSMIIEEGTGWLSAFVLLFSRLFVCVQRREHLRTPKPDSFAHGIALASDFPLRTFASFALKDLLV
jgi:hypothetical protein